MSMSCFLLQFIVPFQKYSYSYKVVFNNKQRKECETIPTALDFSTLGDGKYCNFPSPKIIGAPPGFSHIGFSHNNWRSAWVFSGTNRCSTGTSYVRPFLLKAMSHAAIFLATCNAV